MLIYALQIEPLLSAIRTNPSIHGIRLPTLKGRVEEVKESAFVDDVTALLPDVSSVESIFAEFQKFGSATESKLNEEKTKILLMGEWSESERECLKRWTEPRIKILGVLFGENSKQKTWEINYGRVKAAIDSALRNIVSWLDRQRYAETYLLSLIWYSAVVEPPVASQIEPIAKLLRNFFFGSSWHPIKKETISLPRPLGGINITDPTMRILALRIKTLCKLSGEVQPPFSGLYAYYLGLPLRQYFRWAAANTISHSSSPLGLIPELATLLEAFKRCANDKSFCVLQPITKLLYNTLLSEVPRPRVGSLSPEDFQRVLGVLHSKELKIGGREIGYKMLMNALPFRSLIRSSAQPSFCCPLCRGSEDSVSHLLFRRRLLEETRRLLTQRVKSCVPSFEWNETFILQSGALSASCALQQKRIALHLSAAVKSFWWKLRCRAIDEGDFTVPAASLQEKVLSKCMKPTGGFKLGTCGPGEKDS